jgi:ribosomal-protein-alanine N-acetyltransferase
MEIRPLQLDDAAPLLAFEQANRIWFERFVQRRAASTYSVAGIGEHIQPLLAAHAAGRALAFVMVAADGQIVGRANMKDIDKGAGVAEIGYRIAEQAVGQGLATLAVRHLMDAAAALGLRRLAAVISVENGASARVIERAGFVRDSFLPGHALLAHGAIDCWRYVRDTGACAGAENSSKAANALAEYISDGPPPI